MYYLGSKPTLGYYPGFRLLDGDASRIEVADKTADPGFDLNTASTYPAYQGRAIKTDHVPTAIEWQESAPLPDVNKVAGMLTFPERFREVVESFEPGVHQFLPVEYVDTSGRALAKHYYFIACNRLDSADRQMTRMVLVKGMRWMPAKDLIRWRPEEIPEGFDVEATPKIVFGTAQIGSRHAWCDMFMLSGPYLSDALGAAVVAEGFTGIDISKGEEV